MFCTLKSPRPHRSSSYWHHPVPGVINSAHLENHLADRQRFDVLGVNIFAHLRVRNPTDLSVRNCEHEYALDVQVSDQLAVGISSKRAQSL